MSDPANLVEYSHPDLYDLENPDFEPEGPFYLSLAKETGGPVLELGCGTGRYTIPLANAGFAMTALDIVPAMLAQARQKEACQQGAGLPIQWVEADARQYQLDQQFRFIFESGGVFMHMLTNEDQQAFLRCARKHLAPGGRFLVSLFFPHPNRLGTDLVEKDWFSYSDNQGRTVRVTGTEEYDELRQVKIETAHRRVQLGTGEEQVFVAPLQLRYTFPQEMEGLLSQCGFEVVERFGGPDRSALKADSGYLVYLCK